MKMKDQFEKKTFKISGKIYIRAVHLLESTLYFLS